MDVETELPMEIPSTVVEKAIVQTNEMIDVVVPKMQRNCQEYGRKLICR